MKKLVIVSGLAAMLSGCAVTSMDAKIDPTPSVQQSQVGAGKTVSVSVSDERPSDTLGKRSPAGGTIKMTQDLKSIYQAAIIKGLESKGFKAVGASAPDATPLKVEIRGLDQVSTAGLWTMGSNISAAIKVYAGNGPNRYEQMYRGAAEHRTIAVSGAKSLNEKMNGVVNSQLESMFADNALMTVLAGGTVAQ